MKINQLLTPITKLDEGPIGTAVGAGLGALAGGPLGAAAGGVIGNWAGNKLSQAGTAIKNAWTGNSAGSTATNATPVTGGQTPPAGGQTPPAGGGNQQAFNSAMKAIKTLTPNQKNALAKQLEKEVAQSGGQKPPAQTPPAQTPPADPGAGAFGNIVNTARVNQPPETTSSGGSLQQTPTGQVHTAKPGNPNAAAAEVPAATTPAPAAAPAGNAPLTAQQQAAKVAELKGKRAAGKTTASQTGGGFQNYVAGSPNTRGFDAQGNALPNMIKRESVEFYSRFLGKQI